MKVKPFDDFIKENNLSNTDPKLIKCINNDRGGYILQIGTKETYEVHDVGLNDIWLYFRSYVTGKSIDEYLKNNLSYNRTTRSWEVRNG